VVAFAVSRRTGISVKASRAIRGSACNPAELYLPGGDDEELAAQADRIRTAVVAAAAGGESIRHLDSLLLVDEEMVMHLFVADRRETVERTLHDAGLDAERISPVVPGAERPMVGYRTWRER